MKRSNGRKVVVVLGLVFGASMPVMANQVGATGKIVRMIVNHNANANEIYVTTSDSAPLCASMTLRTSDPLVTDTSYKALYAYLLTAKLSDKTMQFFVTTTCQIYRLEMMD
jgi:hypothetical protein